MPAVEVGNRRYAANVDVPPGRESYRVFADSDGLFYAQPVAVASHVVTMGTGPTPSAPEP